jgi:hypothetical protein
MLHARGGGFAHKVPLREGFLCSRRLGGLGLEVRLMPAQYVKAYIKRNKHYAADAGMAT